VACVICGNAEGNKTHTAREMMFGFRDRFDYLECAGCGCLQLMTPPADLSKYYPQNYYSFSLTPLAIFNNRLKNVVKGWRYAYAVTDHGLVGRMVYGRAPDPVARTLAPLKLTKSSSILDVGCGTGYLLYALRNAGFRNVLGIDPYIDNTITYANGLRILKQSIHEAQGAWDVVMMHHAFEHVPDPLETLQAAARLLKAGGACLIRIPIASSYAWRHYGVNWVQLDAPRHYFLHTVESMRTLGNRVGLRLDSVAYDSTGFQFWGSEQYINGIPLESERSYSKDAAHSQFSADQIAAYEAKARDLNTQRLGDQAAFYLRK
jgi:2-polyprenyl-3-methyl-5-hydroxy-6-metoxy-1,4-benzoquinol methylase